MGIIPLQYLPGQNAETLNLTGLEKFSIRLPDEIKTGQKIIVKVMDLSVNMHAVYCYLSKRDGLILIMNIFSWTTVENLRC